MDIRPAVNDARIAQAIVIAGLTTFSCNTPAMPALAISLWSTTAIAPGALAKGEPRELLGQMQIAYAACDDCDKKVWSNAEAVADALQCIWNRCKRFPTAPEILARWAAAVNKPVQFANPYRSNELLKRESEEKFASLPESSRNDCTLSVLIDPSLNSVQMRAYQISAPETWVAVPGTIKIIYNGDAEFLIWAAGLDGLPIKEKGSTHTPKLIYRSLP